MSEFMLRDPDEPTTISRRWFIRGAVAAVGAAGLAFGQRPTNDLGEKPLIPDGTAVADCACVNEAALPLIAAAAVGEKYYGFAGTSTGPQVHLLNVNARNQVSLGSPIKLDLPEGFVFGSIGSGRGALIISGGVPFVVETLEVDNELTEDVRMAMNNDVPPGIPTTGRQRVEIMGLRPAAFIFNGQSLESLLLPEMPERSFAVASAVTQGANGGVVLLVEHSDGINEHRYASAVDVIEENGREWSVWNAGRHLGESGPNFLAAGGNGIVAGINADRGSYLMERKDAAAPAAVPASNSILALVSEDRKVTALVKDQTGQKVWSSVSSDGRLTAGPLAGIENDELIGAAAVTGAKGQVILLGRRSTVLVQNIPAFLSRARGGDHHVM